MSAQATEPTFRQAQNRHSASGNPCHHFVYHRLTCDQYDELLARAGGHCEMCGTAEPETGGQRLVVDHFQWGQPRIRVIRGMVCDACNSAMSCLDGNKRWGPRRGVLEPRARAYQARVLRGLPPAELALIERVQERQRMRIARPSRPVSSKEKTDERQPSGQRGADRMSEPLIRRRSLPSSLRYLAGKLDEPLSDAERAGVVVALRSLADEVEQACAGPVRPDEEPTP